MKEEGPLNIGTRPLPPLGRQEPQSMNTAITVIKAVAVHTVVVVAALFLLVPLTVVGTLHWLFRRTH